MFLFKATTSKVLHGNVTVLIHANPRILQLRLLAYKPLTERMALLTCITTLLEVKIIKKYVNQRKVSIFLLNIFSGTESVTVKKTEMIRLSIE